MADFKENHICNKCGIKVVKNAIGTSAEFKVAYIERPMGRTQVFEWFLKFKGDGTYAEDSECLEYLMTNKTHGLVEWVKEFVIKNRFLVHKVAEMSLGI
jgi:hypothetical protein